jgi:hypothetical protein
MYEFALGEIFTDKTNEIRKRLTIFYKKSWRPDIF